MHAVIRTGGKQYRVAKDDVLTVERIDGDQGQKIDLQVLMLGDGSDAKFGSQLGDAKVTAELVEQTRGKKLVAFKKRRRKNSRRKIGHKQELTKLRIISIG